MTVARAAVVTRSHAAESLAAEGFSFSRSLPTHGGSGVQPDLEN